MTRSDRVSDPDNRSEFISKQVDSPTLRALPAEPIGYYRQTAHPLVRTVKFLAGIGLVLGLINFAQPILSMMVDKSPGESWADLFELARSVVAGVLIVASVGCLLVWVPARILMILYAYLALVLFGLELIVQIAELSWSARGNLWGLWGSWMHKNLANSALAVVFPVVSLVIFRDTSVREVFSYEPIK